MMHGLTNLKWQGIVSGLFQDSPGKTKESCFNEKMLVFFRTRSGYPWKADDTRIMCKRNKMNLVIYCRRYWPLLGQRCWCSLVWSL